MLSQAYTHHGILTTPYSLHFLSKPKKQPKTLTRSSSADFTSSPYRFRRHGPQNCPLTPPQFWLRQIVFVSSVFCRHWWQVLP